MHHRPKRNERRPPERVDQTLGRNRCDFSGSRAHVITAIASIAEAGKVYARILDGAQLSAKHVQIQKLKKKQKKNKKKKQTTTTKLLDRYLCTRNSASWKGIFSKSGIFGRTHSNSSLGQPS
jgi:hypothetical protein